jgi:hypothetical protein
VTCIYFFLQWRDPVDPVLNGINLGICCNDNHISSTQYATDKNNTTFSQQPNLFLTQLQELTFIDKKNQECYKGSSGNNIFLSLHYFSSTHIIFLTQLIWRTNLPKIRRTLPHTPMCPFSCLYH